MPETDCFASSAFWRSVWFESVPVMSPQTTAPDWSIHSVL